MMGGKGAGTWGWACAAFGQGLKQTKGDREPSRPLQAGRGRHLEKWCFALQAGGAPSSPQLGEAPATGKGGKDEVPSALGSGDQLNWVLLPAPAHSRARRLYVHRSS